MSEDSLTLAINTASSHTAIALLKGGKLLRETSWPAQNSEAEKLMPAIAELVAPLGPPPTSEPTGPLIAPQSLQDISEVIVVRGPGSFTGLRVGITVANTISYLNACPLLSISTFEYWMQVAPTSSSSQVPSIDKKSPGKNSQINNFWKAALLIFAGSRGVYHFIPGRDPEIINIDNLHSHLASLNITQAFGDISQEQKEALKEIEFIETTQTFGQIIASAPKSAFTPEKIIKPLYVKPPSITESKKF